MKIIAKEKCTGKTKELIEYALENDYAIVAFSPVKVESLKEKSLEYFGKEVKVLFYLDARDYTGTVLIDDLDEVIRSLIESVAPSLVLGGFSLSID